MSQLNTELLIGSMLCLLHLGIGLRIGWRFGRLAAPGVPIACPAPPPSIEQTEAERLLTAWRELRQRLNELAAGDNETQQVPPNVLAHWRCELANLTSELHQVLDRKLGRAAAPEVVNSNDKLTSNHNQIPTIEEEPTTILTNAQIEALLSGVGSARKPDPSPPVRYKFPVKQPLAGKLKTARPKSSAWCNVTTSA